LAASRIASLGQASSWQPHLPSELKDPYVGDRKTPGLENRETWGTRIFWCALC